MIESASSIFGLSIILARPKEIGAAWARKGDKKGAIVNLDLIPTDLVNRNGVLFLVPVDSNSDGE